MHLSVDDLLKARDGRPIDAAARVHLDGCSQCTAEVARLARTREALRALPQFEPPAQAWQAIAERAREKAPAPRSFRRALAASVAFLAGFVALALLVSGREVSAPLPEVAAVPEAVVVPETSERGMAELVAQSRELERLLQALPPRRIERVSTAATIDTLERRIQWLDVQLSFAPEAGLSREQEERLWGERVQLMDSLVKVRYADAGRPSF